MTEIFIVFPHQLYREVTKFPTTLQFLIVEDYLFFKQYQFHKHKLTLHRASMKFYQLFLQENNYTVSYLDSKDSNKSSDLFEFVDASIRRIHCWEPDDFNLKKSLIKSAEKCQLTIQFHTPPSFIIDLEDSLKHFGDSKSFRLSSYYQLARVNFNILMDQGKPLHGKWSFDQDNRKKLPKDLNVPALPSLSDCEIVKAAKQYVNQSFPDNPGSTDNFNYPVNYQQAELWLNSFLSERFANFGNYQDAIVSHSTFNFHSVLSPVLNVGLITPDLVIAKAIDYAESNQIPYNSLEGFVRQVLGWREYVRAIYHAIGSKQRTTNFWKHHREIPPAFWTGDTGILPLDDSINKTLKYSYSHHIERLMIVSNFMLLCEFDPDQVYQWFMTLFIDAYDWVMVPNVYGMGLYADGGLIVTKPYISAANYICKMSNYKKDSWSEIWDALYWRFIWKHQDFFKKNPRTWTSTQLLNRMPETRLSAHLKIANNFLAKMDSKQ